MWQEIISDKEAQEYEVINNPLKIENKGQFYVFELQV